MTNLGPEIRNPKQKNSSVSDFGFRPSDWEKLFLRRFEHLRRQCLYLVGGFLRVDESLDLIVARLVERHRIDQRSVEARIGSGGVLKLGQAALGDARKELIEGKLHFEIALVG